MTELRSMTLLRALLALSFVAAPSAAPLGAQEPVRPLSPASPPPPAPAAAPKPVPPPADAVAQCTDLSFVVAPAGPAACSARGGVKVILPGARKAPTTAAAAPAARAAEPPAIGRNDTPPAGATMRCKDGTWLTGSPAASRCDRNGGLAAILPAASTPPQGPPRAP